MTPFSSRVVRVAACLFVAGWDGGGGFACAAAEANATVSRVADPLERMGFLREEIARHDELYYQEANPEISDAEYDQLRRELAELEQRFPAEASRLGASPVRGVGDDRRTGWPKSQHGERMLSLDKTTTEAGLREFDQRLRSLVGPAEEICYVVEPKFDGLAVSVVYEDGVLARIVTRGDGGEGDDVTSGARRIPTLPAKVVRVASATVPKTMELRGEVYMSLAEFERINRERVEAEQPAFSSPRNLAAGTLKSTEHDDRRLEIVFYGLGNVEPRGGLGSQRELLAQLGAWGLPTVTNARVARSIDEVWGAVRALEREGRSLPYPIDGAVVKLDSFAARSSAGATPLAPRWAIAFKFAPSRVSTRLTGITLQVGRTGLITPVAELEPVTLGGAMIARATLHNAGEIARRDLRVGDIVLVERQGDVIPGIAGVDLAWRDPTLVTFVFPTQCPSCGERLGQARGESAWRCENAACPARLQRRVLHFAGCLGVKGLGEATADALVRTKVIRAPSGLFGLTGDQFVNAARLSPAAADALLAEIADAKRAPLWKFVYGWGAPGVGRVGAQRLAAGFGSLEGVAAASETDLRTIGGLGAQTARNVAAYFAEPAVREELQTLRAAGVSPSRAASAGGVFAGKSFVLSGELPSLSHARAAEMIGAEGGKVTANVTRRTSYLVAGANAGTKLERAKALGVAVIDETQLRALLSEREAASGASSQ